MKIKRIWKLYKELRGLRRKVKVLEADLCRVRQNYNALYYKKSQEVPYNTITIMIPNVYPIESEYNLRDVDKRPIADRIYQRMSGQMKIKLVDDLFKQGYIHRMRDDYVCEIYEIKVVR